MFFNKEKLEEKVSTTLYDLTHLEINTIIKEEMCASKAPASPRLILHNLAKTYDQKLIFLGEKYKKYFDPHPDGAENLFRGVRQNEGSGYESFKELSLRAHTSGKLLRDNKDRISAKEDHLDADVMMLQRIETISNDVRRILTMKGVDPCKVDGDNIVPEKKATFNFDDPDTINTFRFMTSREAEQFELKLDLRQLLVIKKANDIGTEKVVLQTIIGMDGDITTRISQAFADQPIPFINGMHDEAVSISVKFWKTLIRVVVKLGERLIGM